MAGSVPLAFTQDFLIFSVCPVWGGFQVQVQVGGVPGPGPGKGGSRSRWGVPSLRSGGGTQSQIWGGAWSQVWGGTQSQ